MAESWLRSMRERIPRGPLLARSLAYGAVMGVAIAAVLGMGMPATYAMFAIHGALLAMLIRLWLGTTRARSGRLSRVLRLTAFGVLLCAAETAVFDEVYRRAFEGPTSITLAIRLENMVVGALLLGFAPSLLLALWIERGRLQPERFWWPARGLAAGLVGSLFASTALVAWFNAKYESSYPDWWAPFLTLQWGAEQPLWLLGILGPTIVLATIVGADSRWRNAAGPGAPGAAARPSPTPPRAEDGPLSTPRLDIRPWPA